MAGTREGALKVAAGIKKKFGPNFYAEMGRKGGKAQHDLPRGFAAMSPERRSAAGRKGGSISRRIKTS